MVPTSQLDHRSTHCRHTTQPMLCYMKTTKDEHKQEKVQDGWKLSTPEVGFFGFRNSKVKKSNISIEKRYRSSLPDPSLEQAILIPADSDQRRRSHVHLSTSTTECRNQQGQDCSPALL